jgi:hypothetical protein
MQGVTIAIPPAGFPALEVANFKIFINGLIVESDAITSVLQAGSDIVITFNSGLGYEPSTSDEYSVSGKFTS